MVVLNFFRMDQRNRLGFYFAVVIGISSVCYGIPILENDSELIGVSKCSTTPLNDAVIKGSIEEVESLIRNGADIYALDCGRLSPMHVAIQSNPDMIDVLVENDFDVNFQFAKGESVLFFAIRKGSTQVVEKLISYGSNVNLVSEQGESPLLEAKMSNKNEVAELLVKNKAEVTPLLANGDTCLHRAAESNSLRVAVLLIDKYKADLNIQNNLGDSPLALAVIRNHPAVINVLLSRGAKLQAPAVHKSYVLLAVKHNSLQALRTLVDHNAPLDNLKSLRDSPFFTAVKMNNLEAAKLLVSHGVDLKRQYVSSLPDFSCRNMSYLHFATFYDYSKSLGWLVDLGIDVNTKAENCQLTALHIAAKYNILDAVKVLLEKGADANLMDSLNYKPRDYAFDEAIKLLLEEAEKRS